MSAAIERSRGTQEVSGKFDTCCNEEPSVLNVGMAEANIHLEALAADVATQNKNIQFTRDYIAALQCEFGSDSPTPE